VQKTGKNSTDVTQRKVSIHRTGRRSSGICRKEKGKGKGRSFRTPVWNQISKGPNQAKEVEYDGSKKGKKGI